MTYVNESEKSKTLTLCGSARFERLFHEWNKQLTLSGHTVFALGAYPSLEGEKSWYSAAEKERLDQVHKLKILRSDAVVLISEEGYVGDSTRSELEFAQLLGKHIYTIEPDCSVLWDWGVESVGRLYNFPKKGNP